MTQKSSEIRNELDKTNRRITELETDLTEQTTTFETVQQGFIAGKSDVEQLHAEQSKLTLISRAIESLRATYQKLKAAFENQSEAEKRTELLNRMKTTANEVGPLVNDYLETRNEFHELIKKYAEKLIREGEIYRNKQSEYRAIVAELKPTAAEIQSAELDPKTLRLAKESYVSRPTLEYSEVIGIAESLLISKLNKAADAKRTAEFQKKRASEQV